MWKYAHNYHCTHSVNNSIRRLLRTIASTSTPASKSAGSGIVPSSQVNTKNNMADITPQQIKHHEQIQQKLRKQQQEFTAATSKDSSVSSATIVTPLLKSVEYPLHRRWIQLQKESADQTQEDGSGSVEDSSATPSTSSSNSASSSSSPFSFTVASYNMLAQSLVRRDLFPYCSKQSLKIGFRKDNLLLELLNLDADIFALQEVDKDIFDNYWTVKLGGMGYKWEWGARLQGAKHGCAIFYRAAKFEQFASSTIQFADVLSSPYVDNEDNQHADLNKRKASVYEEMNRPNVAMIVGLKVKPQNGDDSSPPLGLYVSNTHLFWDPRYRFVRLKQCQTLLDQIAVLQARYETAYPTVLMGDFNVTPDNIIYHYLTERNELERNEETWTKFLTPAEHGMVRGAGGEENAGAASSEAPASSSAAAASAKEELKQNSGISASSLANLVAAVKVSPDANGASAGSSSQRGSFSNASGSGSNAPIHQLRTQLIVGSDGSVKEHALEQAVDHSSAASQLRLSEVKDVLHHSRSLPLLQSLYEKYTSQVPDDLKSSIVASQKASYCRWEHEAPYTNYTQKFKGTLDYIFVPRQNPAIVHGEKEGKHNHIGELWHNILTRPDAYLQATHILEIPREELVNQNTALPNETISSDHISIAARLMLSHKAFGKVASDEPSLALAKSIAASLAPPTSPQSSSASHSFATNVPHGASSHTIASSTAASSSSSSAPQSAAAPVQQVFPAFNVALFDKLLHTKFIGRPLHYAAEVSSTMDLCQNALFGSDGDKTTTAAANNGALWLADFQTKGRGRVEGRRWASTQNANLYFTLLYQLPGTEFSQLRKMNQIVCISVAKAIEQSLATSLGVGIEALPEQLQPKIKWPNDVWINGKKVSGVLIDVEHFRSTMSMVIGVGLNTFEDYRLNADKSLQDFAASVKQSLDEYVAATKTASSPKPLFREVLLAHFLHAFEAMIGLEFSQIMQEYKKYDMLLQKNIIVMPRKKEDVVSFYEAKAIDYSEDGYLVVQTFDGSRKELVAEEVTIRPSLKA